MVSFRPKRSGAEKSPFLTKTLSFRGDFSARSLRFLGRNDIDCSNADFISSFISVVTLGRFATSLLNAPTISAIVRHFKGYTTRAIGESIWQKSFYDHVICDESDYDNIWNYIDTNPDEWQEDEYFRSQAR